MLLQDLLTQAAGVASSRRAKTLTPAHLKSTVHADDTFDFLKSIFDRVPDLETKVTSAGDGGNGRGSSAAAEPRAPRRSVAAGAAPASSVAAAASSSSGSLRAFTAEATGKPPAKRRRGRPPLVAGAAAASSPSAAGTADSASPSGMVAGEAKRHRADALVRSGSGRGRGRGRGGAAGGAAAVAGESISKIPISEGPSGVALPSYGAEGGAPADAAAATTVATEAALRVMDPAAIVAGGVDGDVDEDYDGEGASDAAPRAPLPPGPAGGPAPPPAPAGAPAPPPGSVGVPTLPGSIRLAPGLPPLVGGGPPPALPPANTSLDPLTRIGVPPRSGAPPSAGPVGLPPLLGGGTSVHGSGNLGLGPGVSLPSLPARSVGGSALPALPTLDRPAIPPSSSQSIRGAVGGSSVGVGLSSGVVGGVGLPRPYLPPLNQPLTSTPLADGSGLYGYRSPAGGASTGDGGRFGGGGSGGPNATRLGSISAGGEASRYGPPPGVAAAYPLRAPTSGLGGSGGSLPGGAAPLGALPTAPYWAPAHSTDPAPVGPLAGTYASGPPRPPAPAWSTSQHPLPPLGLPPLGQLRPAGGSNSGSGDGRGDALPPPVGEVPGRPLRPEGYLAGAGGGGAEPPPPAPPDGGGRRGGRGGRDSFSSLLN